MRPERWAAPPASWNRKNTVDFDTLTADRASLLDSGLCTQLLRVGSNGPVHARTRNASHHRRENDRTNGSKCVRFPPQGRKQPPVRRPDGLRLQEQLRPAVLEVQAEMALVQVPSPTRNRKPISDCPDSDGPFAQTKQP